MIIAGALVLFTAHVASGFVYSCYEAEYQLLNAGPKVSSNSACIVLVLETNGYNLDELRNVYLQSGTIQVSLPRLAELGCITHGGKEDNDEWSLVSYPGSKFYCDYYDLSLLFTASPNIPIDASFTATGTGTLEQVFAHPEGGIVIRMDRCSGDGTITWHTGAGDGEREKRFAVQSWKCTDLPLYIVTFDNVITIVADAGVSYEYTVTEDYGKLITLDKGDRATVISSGRSDNLMNLYDNYAKFIMKQSMALTVAGSATLDSTYKSEVYISVVKDKHELNIASKGGSFFWSDDGVTSIIVAYESETVATRDISERQDTFVVNLAAGEFTEPPDYTRPATTSTKQPLQTTTSAAETVGSGSYCGCNMGGKFNLPIDWDPSEIWLDVAVILDTSEAMGEDSLAAAASMIESFVGDGVLVTDLSAAFSTRVGVISMARDAEVLYDLNMTSTDRIEGKAHISKGVDEIDVVKAFDAALDMFNRGVQHRPERGSYRQVIYYVTDSDPKVNLNALNQFKTSQGVIIVNNFLEEGDTERPGLQELASDGFYLKDIREDYMMSIQAFCKANCFCPGDRDPYAGKSPDPALKSAGGCYHPVSAGVPYAKAQHTCSDTRGGLVASVHDNEKAAFLNDLVMKVYKKKYYFWIGYSKNGAGSWIWEDKSTDSFTNWDADEPSDASIAKCAYADMTEDNLPWGAGNCNLGLPYVCEYMPCQAGNKIC